jgi:GNAT superfamily N-acetyltransferase
VFTAVSGGKARLGLQLSIKRAEDTRTAGQQVSTLLGQFNEQAVGPPAGVSYVLVITAPGSDEILGGLRAVSYWGSFYITDVVVPEAARGQDLGSELMREAEREARARGCAHMWLDTFAFQARPFYERLGFEIFGQLDGPAPYFPRYFLQKPLEPPAGS